jgi:hypothetical protein
MASYFSGRAGRLAAIYGAQQLENAQSDLNNAETRSLAELGMGYDRAAAAYKPTIDLFGRGANLYADSLGLNGAEGIERARVAFAASPGYAFARDQALQAAERGASAGGQLASGNLLAALQDRAGSLAAQDYNNWLTALGGYNPLYTNATSRFGDVGMDYGKGRAGIVTDNANQRAGLTSRIADIGMAGLQAGQKASENRYNFGMQLGKTIADVGMKAFGTSGPFAKGAAFGSGGRWG